MHVTIQQPENDSISGKSLCIGNIDTNTISNRNLRSTEQIHENCSLLDLAGECISHSILIFHYADLRVLSSSGLISTPFETLCIDSDFVLKTNSSVFSGICSSNDNAAYSSVVGCSETNGISAAQIMAISMIEIRKDLQLNRKSKVPITELNEKVDSNLKALNDMICEGLKSEDTKSKFFLTRSQTQVVETKNEEMNVTDQDSYEKVGRAFFSMAGTKNDAQRKSLGFIEKKLDNDQILSLMESLVAARSTSQGEFRFMENFFKKGSLASLMAQSHSKLMWMNDWCQQHELTYAISINKKKRRVMVLFRGCKTSKDWEIAFKRGMMTVANPIQDNYKGKNKDVNLHVGFYEYLFRVRKDTGKNKYDEICGRVIEYANEILGDNFTLLATGHSLGGALATLFSFYASLDDRFSKNGPVEAVTFGNPHVGGFKFAKAFKHQEKNKKIRVAYFYSDNDVVAHIPINSFGQFFVRVGVRVPLRSKTFGLLSRRTVLMYPKTESWIKSHANAFKNNFLFHITFPWNIKSVHSLVETQKRLVLVRNKRNDDKSELMKKSMKVIYETLVYA